VARALQRYADRGVFRGLSSHRGRGGRFEFQFTWLMRQPMTLVYDERAAALTFRNLLPRVGSTALLREELYELIDGLSTRAVPAHKRIDGRRARLIRSARGGNFSLTLVVRGRHHEYAVRKGLNLVNDLFVLLHASYPDYLVEQFGFPAE